MPELLKKMDWSLLRAQKMDLLEYRLSGALISHAHTDGLISLLDALQDEAVERGYATDSQVYGCFSLNNS